jgi:hypothetical protein
MEEVVANIKKHLEQYNHDTQERLIKGLWSTRMNEGGLDSQLLDVSDASCIS